MFQRIGAAFYVVWGVLHLVAAQKVWTLAQSLDAGMVQGRVFQDAAYLLFFAVFGIYIAVRYNWRNSNFGYWLNLLAISAADIPYIVFVLLPGYVPTIPGANGPIVWVLAVIFSTLAYLAAQTCRRS